MKVKEEKGKRKQLKEDMKCIKQGEPDNEARADNTIWF
jgi:hypothetical protein